MNQIVINFQNTVVLIALLYGLSLAGVLLLRNWKNKNTHFWLGVFLFVFSIVLLDTYLKIIYLGQIFPFIKWTYYRLISLIPYTLWIYISHLVIGKFTIRRFEKVLLAFVGIDASFRIYAFVISAMGHETLASFNDKILDTWLEVFIIAISLITMIKAIQLVGKYQKQLENNYSAKTKNELKWVKELLSVLLVVILIWIVAVPINFFYAAWSISVYWIWIAQALIIFYFGIKGHLQPEIFHEFPLVPAFEESIIEEKSGFPKSKESYTVEERKNDVYIKLIENSIQEDKIYRQPKLSLQDMAKELNVPTRHLSKLINQHYNCSFSDFINQQRVEEIKERIVNQEDEKLTLLALALEAGFNSKSSFNFMFKKFTGATPIQFKNTLGK